MTQQRADLEALITTLVRALVPRPENVRTEVSETSQTASILLTATDGVTCSILVGRAGETIRALRRIVACAGARMGFKAVSLDLSDGSPRPMRRERVLARSIRREGEA